MRPLRCAFVAFVVVVAGVGAVGVGCTLTPYPSNLVRCDPEDADCPGGFACLDLEDEAPAADTTTSFCVRIGCGDGIIDPTAGEECDDANDNDLDLCVGCKLRRYELDEAAGVAFGALGLGQGAGADARVGQPTVVAVDADRNVYFSSVVTNLLLRLDNGAQQLTTFAGNGSTTSRLAPQAQPNEISTVFATSMAIDGTGNVFLTDFQDSVIRRIDAVSGAVTIVAGTGVRAAGDDSNVATAQPLDLPVAIAVDGDGNVFFSDRDGDNSGRVRRLGRDGGLRTLALSVSFPGAPTPPGVTGLVGRFPDDVVVDGGLLHIFTAAALSRPSPASPLVDAHIVDTTFVLGADGGIVEGSEIARGCRTSTVRDVPRDDGEIDHVFVSDGPCPPPRGNQERFVIDDAGAFGFYMSGLSLVRVELGAIGDIGAADADAVCADACVVVGDVVDPDGDGNFFSLDPSDLAYDHGDIVVADPAGGVLWRFVDATGAAPAPPIVIAGAPQPPELAFERTVDVLLLEFAKQTDARLGVNLAPVSCEQPPSDALTFRDFEFLAPFPDLHRVLLVSCADQVTVLAGDGVKGFAGDGGPAESARLNRPTAAARAGNGDIFIADRDNDRVRRIRDPAGAATIETFIGGDSDIVSDGASPLQIARPSGLASGADGELYVSDPSRHQVWRVDVDSGVASVVVGTGVAGFNGDDQPRTETQLNEPTALVFVPFLLLRGVLSPDLQGLLPENGGLLLIAERSGQRIRAVFTGVPPLSLPEVLTLAGDGVDGDDDNVDGRAARFSFPRGLMLSFGGTGADPTLGLIVVDAIDRLRRVTINVDIAAPSLLATSVATALHPGRSRDDGPPADALFKGPVGVAAIDDAHVAVVDRITGRVRLVDVDSGDVSTITGMPDGDDVDDVDAPVPASRALPLRGAGAIAVDGRSPVSLWITESDVGRLRRVTLPDIDDPTGFASTSLDTGLVAPAGIAIDDGTAYVSDAALHVIARVDLDSGDSTVIAGSAFARGSSGDGGPALDALFNEPRGLAVLIVDDQTRVLVVADSGNNRLRRLNLADGTVEAVLGDGAVASGGEGAPAAAFSVAVPRGVDVDRGGNVVVTSQNALRFVQSGRDFIFDGGDDVRSIYGKAPRVTFPEPVTRCLADVAFGVGEGAPDVYAVDSCVGVLLRLRPTLSAK